MKYFIIDYSLDEKIVGTDYPQVHKFIKGYDPEAPQALFSLYKYKKVFPEFIPDLDGIMLAGYAKLTDFVSNGFSGRFFIMSERAKSIFEQCKLCEHQFYPLGLYKRKQKHEYFLLNITVSDYSDVIDYERSSFVIYERVNSKNNQNVNIGSKEEYSATCNKLMEEKGITWGIKGENIVLKNTFENFDFFEINRFDSNTYISERLTDLIESNRLTGWEFTLATNLIIEE